MIAWALICFMDLFIPFLYNMIKIKVVILKAGSHRLVEL